MKIRHLLLLCTEYLATIFGVMSMIHRESSRRKNGRRHFGLALALGVVLACSSSFAFARSHHRILRGRASIDNPGMVQMVDGRDRGNQVQIGIWSSQLQHDGYDFGYMDGGIFHSLTGSCNWSRAVFSGGALVDFALRKRIGDDGSSTSDYQYYRLSDAGGYAVQDYFSPVGVRNSRNPVVSGAYYKNLLLYWDPDQDQDRDVTVKLWAQSRFDGMQFVSSDPAPVPLPASVWLLGSGTLMLALLGAIAQRRQS